MGNNESKPTKSFTDSLQFYKKSRDVNDYRFGAGEIWTRSGAASNQHPIEEVLVKEKWAMSRLIPYVR
jgi:hypothetical protein